MPLKTSPVTPAVVRWAVDEDGRSFSEVADALHLDVDTLDGWTSGDVLPTQGQVSELAKVLHRPRALFFMPAPPVAGGLPANFRHPPGSDHATSAKALRVVRQSRRLQTAVAWARSETQVDLPRFSSDVLPGTAAEAVRNWLGVPIERQANWRDDRAALGEWREILRAHGVLAFMLQIGAGEIRGFSLWNLHAPLVAANSSRVSASARIFTMMHELGHLVRRQESACVVEGEDAPDEPLERWCEGFAGALLMPESDVRYIAGHPVKANDQGMFLVRQLMRRYRVSARAVARRLIDLELGRWALYRRVEQEFQVRQQPDTNTTPKSEPRPKARLRQYGADVIETVFTALPPRDALSVLRIEVEDARQMVEDVPSIHVP